MWAWTCYDSTNHYLTTGSWIAWIVTILFWPSNIVLASVRTVSECFQASIVWKSLLFFHLGVQPSLWLLCFLNGRDSIRTDHFWFLSLHSSCITWDRSSSMAFVASSSLWLCMNSLYKQSPDFCGLLLMKLPRLFVLTIPSSLEIHFWLHPCRLSLVL